MKVNLSTIFYLLASLLFAQQNLPAFGFPVYPGCEKVSIKDERLQCFQKKIAADFTTFLQKYVDAFEYLNLKDETAKVEFVVSKDGELILKFVETLQPQYKEYNVLAFADLVKSFKEKKKKISPAYSLIDGEKLSISLALPVSFSLKNPLLITENRLIATLYDRNEQYEIVETPNQDFKIYNISGERPFYLGKYTTLKEIAHTLPYKTLIENTSEMVTLMKKEIGNQNFILQSKNIFQEKSFKTLFVISEVKENKIKQLYKFYSLKDFVASPYYQWIIREN